MRLDKYLKISRLIKRRTVANEACDAGRVLVNGKEAGDTPGRARAAGTGPFSSGVCKERGGLRALHSAGVKRKPRQE